MRGQQAGDGRTDGTDRSVRERSRRLGRLDPWLVVILAVITAIGGARMLSPFFIRGDLLYHWGLTRTMLLGAIPPEGPYDGLPAYYPPGFHALLAAGSAAFRIDVESVTALLGLLWLPVIPLAAYVLAYTLIGRRSVALTAAVLTAFAGGLDLSADRLWVNSMTMVGQVAVPIYPRDLVFGLLPFAVLAFVRAVEPRRRWAGWAIVAGLLLGACAWLQVQLLLPIPPTLFALAVVVGLRRHDRARQAALALALTGAVASAVIAPWLVGIVATISANGGVSIDSSEELMPFRIGFWDYPIQFGLLLPLAIIGAGVVLLLLRRPDGPRLDDGTGRWTQARADTAVLLVPWWLLPFALAVLYQPSWPLEDAVRPQRMWLLASQPGLVLAAIGVVAAAEALVARLRMPSVRLPLAPARLRLATIGLVMLTCAAASLPATIATQRLVWSIWRQPTYAHLSLTADRVPDMQALLPVAAPRPTILSYEDWSARIWYETGAGVVAIEPPGYAKLAFDPEAFTGHGQAERRMDVTTAFRGDVNDLIRIAGEYAAERIVLARRGASIGLISLPATIAAGSQPEAGGRRTIRGNGWDAVVLEPGATLSFDLSAATPIDLQIRMLRRLEGPRAIADLGTGRFELRMDGRSATPLIGPTGLGSEFATVTTTITVDSGDRLVVHAIDRIAIQAITGFVVDPGPPPGWRIERVTDDATVWARQP